MSEQPKWTVIGMYGGEPLFAHVQCEAKRAWDTAVRAVYPDCTPDEGSPLGRSFSGICLALIQGWVPEEQGVYLRTYKMNAHIAPELRHRQPYIRSVERILDPMPEKEYTRNEKPNEYSPEPVCCPFCKTEDVIVYVADGWPAFSWEDPDNRCVLEEHQCRNETCSRSFWT